MSKRTLELIEELKLAFGRTFGTVVPSQNDDLLEAFELSEDRPRKSPGKSPSKKIGRGGGGKGGGGFPPRKKGGPTISQKKLKRAADKSRQQKDADGDSAFNKAMGDIRGDMDKSKEKSKGGDGFVSNAMRHSKARKDANVHHPFKHSSTRGVGPRGRSDRQTKCWSCTCHGGIYKSGCECKASGNGEKCPEKGTIKKIDYKPSYHRAYNDEYHAWRRKQTRFNKR